MKISRDMWPMISDKHRQTASPKTIALRPVPCAPRPAEKGIALVITLIMLSVTLVMAVAFLALSQRERKSVSTTTDTTTARLAADSALNAAQAQVIATMLANNSANYNFGLLVSTNYQNNFGFVPGAVSPTNVNYDYTSDGSGYSSVDMVQNIANLQFLPRVPVFINNDFRFYLDLNRNGKFEPTGPAVPNIDYLGVTNGTVPGIGDPQWIGVLERPDAPHGPNNKFVARIAFFGAPIGNTLDINYVNNAAKTPATKTLFNSTGADFNRNQGVGSWEINLGAFFTELNTNSYAWDFQNYSYNYNPIVGSTFLGPGFQDAASIYAYRLSGNPSIYTYNTANLPSINNVFGFNAGNIFGFDLVDQYSDGPLQLTTVLPSDNDQANANYPWPGAPSTNQFSDLAIDLYDVNKTGVNGFTNRLLNANSGFNSVNPATYDRYTLYRLLSQLGTDSEPDTGKMNLNYSNVFIGYNLLTGAPTNITTVSGAETNLISWLPLDFFTAAANRLLMTYSADWFASNPSNYLQTYYGFLDNNANYYHYNPVGILVTNDPTGFGLTNALCGTNVMPAFGIANIPVYINGEFVYTPAVNRLLQLAANLYDATTNNSVNGSPDWPSVFRPTFLVTNQFGFKNIYINGYEQVLSVSGTTDPRLAPPMNVYDLPLGFVVTNVYNVPWIIGAKKGFPNFNSFVEQNTVSLTRRVLLTRDTNAPATANGLSVITATNQMYLMNMQSSIGVGFWNSYASNYQNSVTLLFRGSLRMGLTNDEGAAFTLNENAMLPNGIGFNYGQIVPSLANWPGWNSLAGPSKSFQIFTNNLVAGFQNPISTYPNSVYRSRFATPSGLYANGLPVPLLLPTNTLDPNAVPPGPGLVFETNGAGFALPNFQFPQFSLLTTNQFQAFIIDNVSSKIIDYVQLSQISTRNLNSEIFNNNQNSVWNTNALIGIQNQIAVSKLNGQTFDTADDGIWQVGNTDVTKAKFSAFFSKYGQPLYYGANGTSKTVNTQSTAEPVAPTCSGIGYVIWQANDPLVHYTTSDLALLGLNLSSRMPMGTTMPSLADLSLGTVNLNYMPWGWTNAPTGSIAAANTGNTAFQRTNAYAPWIKDPGMTSSSAWDFPTNKFPSAGWLGRVHRGTPWQTVYLKSTDVVNDFGVNSLVWPLWTGDQNLYDASGSAPKSDRRLFDLFTSAVNEDATRGNLPVNVGANDRGGLAAWSAVLSGVVVPTSTTNSYTVIQPSGAAGTTTNSAVGFIVNSINAARANTNDFPQAVFKHIGDVLRAPALTQQSPFLAGMDTNLISDEIYEALPQQVMGLLRISSTPRYVVYGYGQTLRPAPDGLVMSAGDNFGLVTNYQVVAESAVRAVIAVQAHTNIVTTSLGAGFETNYTTQVENYNVLAPQ